MGACRTCNATETDRNRQDPPIKRKKYMTWAVDTKTGVKMNFSKPFATKEAAILFAIKNGLGKKNVKSRPAGFVVERD